MTDDGQKKSLIEAAYALLKNLAYLSDWKTFQELLLFLKITSTQVTVKIDQLQPKINLVLLWDILLSLVYTKG